MRLYHKKIANIDDLRAERKRLNKQAKELLPDMSLLKKGEGVNSALGSSSALWTLAIPILKQVFKSYDKATLAKITTKFIGKYLKWEIKASLINLLLDWILPNKKTKKKSTT